MKAGYINLFTVRHDPGRLHHVFPGHRGPVSGLALDYDQKSFFSAGWDGEAIASFFLTAYTDLPLTNFVAQQWDLNTGQNVRTFIAHHAQLTSIALRPQFSGYVNTGPAVYHSQSTQQPSEAEPVTQTQTQASSDPMNLDPASQDAPKEEDPSSMEQSGTNSQTMADSDTRSDASFDPLFDDVPEEEDKKPDFLTESLLAMPGSWTPPRPQQPPRPAPTVIPPPKGAPPLFDPVSYSSYSPEILMTAFIDGQVLLWDRRVQTNGQGVGRLWMSEKTPPWCLSVSSFSF